MLTFLDREDEVATLNELLTNERAQLVMMHGRRRVGKTTIHTMLFARHSFTSATEQLATETDTRLITFTDMMDDSASRL